MCVLEVVKQCVWFGGCEAVCVADCSLVGVADSPTLREKLCHLIDIVHITLLLINE